MSAISFKAASAQADAILKSDKAARPDLKWSKMLLSTLPADLQALAVKALNAQLEANEAKDALQSGLDDKVDSPAGKRLIVTLGRRITSDTD